MLYKYKIDNSCIRFLGHVHNNLLKQISDGESTFIFRRQKYLTFPATNLGREELLRLASSRRDLCLQLIIFAGDTKLIKVFAKSPLYSWYPISHLINSTLTTECGGRRLLRLLCQMHILHLFVMLCDIV